MPTVTTNYFRQELASGNVNLSGDTFKVALVDNWVSTQDEQYLKARESYSAGSDPVSSFECIGTGYSALTLNANQLQMIYDNVSWSGTNISWNNVTVEAYGLSIFRASDGLVVGFIDFGKKVDAVNGSITIQWNENGIANII